MKLYVDSADLEELAKLKRVQFTNGVTTNPKLIAEGMDKSNVTEDEYVAYLQEIRKFSSGELFIQITSTTKDEMVAEALKIKEVVKGPIVFKIPATAQGFAAISHLSKEGLSVAATAVYTESQSFFATVAGATYIIAYYSRLDQEDHQGIESINEIMSVCGPEKLLVTSVESMTTLHYLMMKGVQNFTVPYKLFENMAECDLTLESVKGLNEALVINWKKRK